MIGKCARVVFIFYTVIMFIVPEIKRTGGFTNIKSQAGHASKSINNAFFLTIKIVGNLRAQGAVLVFFISFLSFQHMRKFFVGRSNALNIQLYFLINFLALRTRLSLTKGSFQRIFFANKIGTISSAWARLFYIRKGFTNIFLIKTILTKATLALRKGRF